MSQHVIIVGAGPGGLAAGILLAHHGYEVDIYETKDTVGGRNGSISLGSYTFDIGPTFLMMKFVLEEIFQATGRSLHDYVKLTELDPMYRLVFSPDKIFYPTRDPQKMKQEIERLFPGNSNGYDRYLKKEKKKYEQLVPCLQIPYASYADFLTKRFITSLPYIDAHKSLYTQLSQYFSDPDLITSFTFQAKYIGMSPWEAPGTFSIISYIEHGLGIFHVEGGLNVLSKAMARVIEEEGGKIHLGTEVRKLITEDGTARGVELKNGQIRKADAVVMNADFAYGMTDLVDPGIRKKYSDAKLKQKQYSCSTFMLYLGVDKIYRDIPHHNILFSENYRKNVDEITIHRALSEDPSIYVQNASVTDKTLAPEGKSTLYVLVPTPNQKSGINWSREADAFKEKILSLMESRGGFTDLRSHIEVEKIITPDNWEKDYNVYLGATFNLGHQISQMMIWRPHNVFEEIKNCYLVGGGTHPGSGLPTIYESGRITADCIIKRLEKSGN